MKWFKHDTDASSDAKIKKLIMRHGAEGYAIYFHCIELIAGNVCEQNITFELEHDAEIIADNLKIKGDENIAGIDKVNIIMRTIVDLGLFEESESRIFCSKLAKRLDQSMTGNKKMRKIIENVKESHDIVMLEEKRREEIRIEKNREDEKKDKRFKKPTIDEIEKYIHENNIYGVKAEKFYNYYESIDWKVGKHKMKKWKNAVRTWEQTELSKLTWEQKKSIGRA